MIEGNESFSVSLSSPSSGTSLGTATATGTILNDDFPPPPSSLSIVPLSATKAEGHSGHTTFTFTVTRSGNLAGTSTAKWAVTGSGGDPATAADFAGATLPGGTVGFASGETSKTLSVNVVGDTIIENSENFIVTLSELSGSTVLGAASAAGTILNDDATLTISGPGVVTAEGNSGGAGHTFTVTRAGDTTSTSSVFWAVTGSGVNPADAVDFVGSLLPLGVVSFGAGETSKTVTITVADDTTVEPDEDITVTLSGASVGATIIVSKTTLSIANDDVITPGADVIEGGSGGDTLTGLGGNDVLDGKAGEDVANYAYDVLHGGMTAIVGDLERKLVVDGFGNIDTLISIESIYGTEATSPHFIGYCDVIAGSDAPNVLDARGGNDLLSGKGGGDKLLGGDGDDLLLGDGGRDTLVGGAGSDAMMGGGDEDTFQIDLAAMIDGQYDLVADFELGIDDIVAPLSVYLQTTFMDQTIVVRLAGGGMYSMIVAGLTAGDLASATKFQ